MAKPQHPERNGGLEFLELTEGWAVAALGDCAALITKGTTPTTAGFHYKSAGIAFVRVENLANGRIRYDSIRTFIDEAANKALKRSQLEAGDILFSIAGTIGRSALVRESDLPANTNQALAIVRGTEAVLDPAYLRLLLESSVAQTQATSEARGGAMNNISLADVAALRVPVPPRAEQKRIVAKIDVLLALVDTAREQLAKVPAILRRFRQSVLAAACSGRLTSDWRDSHPEVDSASALLKRTDAARAQLAGRLASKPPEPVPSGNNDSPEIPESWIWTCGARLFSWSSGKFLPKKKQREGSVPVYGGNGITGYHDQTLIDRKTLVIGRVGALCGNVYVTEKSAWITDNAIYAAFVPKAIELAYVQFVLTRTNLNRNAGGSGQPFVDQGMLNAAPIPLPPLDEQREIVRRVEALFKLADAIEKRVATATTRTEKLTQSVLARAFRGQLVATEAELARREHRQYEPASVLLESTHAQRVRKQHHSNRTSRSPL